MSLIDILKGLLQSTCNSGSNGVSFVMLSALVIEPFDTKLSTLVDGRNFLKMGWGFRRRTKMSTKKMMMSCIDILEGLLQSTHTSGSNGVSFVMLSALVSEPFNAKLSTLVDGRNFFTMGRGFRLRTKMSIKKLWCHVLTFWRVYCNLHTILVQMVSHLSCWLHWSQSLSTQNFSSWLTDELFLE